MTHISTKQMSSNSVTLALSRVPAQRMTTIQLLGSFAGLLGSEPDAPSQSSANPPGQSCVWDGMRTHLFSPHASCLASFPLAAHTTSSDSKQFFSDTWSHVCLPKSMCWNFIALFDGARRWGCWQVTGHEGVPCDRTGALVRETLGPSPSLTSVHGEGASLDSDPAGS